MKQGTYSGKGRSRRHSGNGNNNMRRHGGGTPNRNTVFDSIGPCGRIKGNASQIAEKYLAAARDAQGQNDRVLAENCLQHADHYYRIVALTQAAEQPREQTAPMNDSDDDHLPFGPEDDMAADASENRAMQDTAADEPSISVVKTPETVPPAFLLNDVQTMDLSVPVGEISRPRGSKLSLKKEPRQEQTTETAAPASSPVTE